jgi:hypothetical protein
MDRPGTQAEEMTPAVAHLVEVVTTDEEAGSKGERRTVRGQVADERVTRIEEHTDGAGRVAGRVHDASRDALVGERQIRVREDPVRGGGFHPPEQRHHAARQESESSTPPRESGWDRHETVSHPRRVASVNGDGGRHGPPKPSAAAHVIEVSMADEDHSDLVEGRTQRPELREDGPRPPRISRVDQDCSSAADEVGVGDAGAYAIDANVRTGHAACSGEPGPGVACGRM